MPLVLFSLLAASATVSFSSPPIYDEREAVRLLYFAAASYGGRAEECARRSTGEEDDWSLHTTNNDVDCDVMKHDCGLLIAHSRKREESVIAFRGTQGVGQLFNEGMQAILPKMDLLGMGKFNRYFLDAHWTTWTIVEKYLKDKRYAMNTIENYSVSVTGHSLGGALASIAALRIVYMGFRPSEGVRLYTFGEPRVGDVHFARLLDRLIPESFRIVHSSLTSPSAGGTGIGYPDSMDTGMKKYKICDGLPVSEDASCSNSVHFQFSSTYFTDHTRYFGVLLKVSDFGKNGCRAELTGRDEYISLIGEFLANLKKFIPFL